MLAPEVCAPQTPLMAVCRRSTGAVWPVTKQSSAGVDGSVLSSASSDSTLQAASSGRWQISASSPIRRKLRIGLETPISDDTWNCLAAVKPSASRNDSTASTPTSERAGSGKASMRCLKADCISTKRSTYSSALPLAAAAASFFSSGIRSTYSALSHSRLAAMPDVFLTPMGTK